MSIQIQIYLSVIIDHDTFFCRVNGGRIIPGKEVVTLGNYKLFLDDTPIFDAKSYDHDSSHEVFRTAFPDGFPWEVLSGPPKVTFTWRHWTKWTGPYKDQQPTGEEIKLQGVTITTVTEDLKIKSLEFFMDSNPM